MRDIIRIIKRRIALMLGRCLLNAMDDSSGFQTIKIKLLNGELRDGVERIQNYGFSGVPGVDAEGVAVAMGGNRDHVMVVALDERANRKKNMADGETAVWTRYGDFVHLKADGTIHVQSSSTVLVDCVDAVVNAAATVTLNTPECTITGNLAVGGNTDIGGALTVGGDADVAGASTAASLVTTGAVAAAGGVTSSGTPFDSHVHGGVSAGVETSGGPQ